MNISLHGPPEKSRPHSFTQSQILWHTDSHRFSKQGGTTWATIHRREVRHARRGKESLGTNSVLVELLAWSAEGAGVPEGSIQMVASPSQHTTTRLMSLEDLDVLIPRGGTNLSRPLRAPMPLYPPS
jgi:hypothetical protein